MANIKSTFAAFMSSGNAKRPINSMKQIPINDQARKAANQGLTFDMNSKLGSKSIPETAKIFGTVVQDILRYTLLAEQQIPQTNLVRGILKIGANALLNAYNDETPFVEKITISPISQNSQFYDMYVDFYFGQPPTKNITGLLTSSNYFSTKVKLFDTRNTETERNNYTKRIATFGQNQKAIIILKEKSFLSLQQLQEIFREYEEEVVKDYIVRQSKKLIRLDKSKEKLKEAYKKFTKSTKMKSQLEVLKNHFSLSNYANDFLTTNFTAYAEKLKGLNETDWLKEIIEDSTDDLSDKNILEMSQPELITWNYGCVLCLENELTLFNQQPGPATKIIARCVRPKKGCENASVDKIGTEFIKQFPDTIIQGKQGKPNEYDFLQKILTTTESKLKYCNYFNDNFETVRIKSTKTVEGGYLHLRTTEFLGGGINLDNVFINPLKGDPRQIPAGTFWILEIVGTPAQVQSLETGQIQKGLGPGKLVLENNQSMCHIYKGKRQTLPAKIQTRPYENDFENIELFYEEENVIPEIETIDYDLIDMDGTKGGKAKYALLYPNREQKTTYAQLINNLKIDTQNYTSDQINQFLNNVQTYFSGITEEEEETNSTEQNESQ